MTPVPCLHKRARHIHGTRTCYILDRCRCQPCKQANRAAKNDRARRIAYGTWDAGRTDAQPVRDHLAMLAEHGVGLKAVSAATGVSTGTLDKIVYGVPSRGIGRRRRVEKATAAKLLALTVEAARRPGHRVDPTGTLRRLRALAACGWSVGAVAAATGVDRQALYSAMRGAPILARNAAQLAAAYPALAETDPPTGTRSQRAAVTRTLNRAAAEGWLPPERWHDDLDDPYAEPLPQVVASVTAEFVADVIPAFLDDGDQARIPTADLAAAAERLLAQGLSRRQIAERFGMTPDRVERALARWARRAEHPTAQARAAGGAS